MGERDEDKDNKTPAYSLIKHGVNIFYCNTIEPIQIKNDFKFFNYSKYYMIYYT